MRPDGTFGLGGGSAPPAAPARRRRAEAKTPPRGADGAADGGEGVRSARRAAWAGLGAPHSPLRRGRGRHPERARRRASARGDGRPRAAGRAGSPEPMTPYQPPPEIPDIEMIFAKNPEHAGLRSFAPPLGTNRGACRARREGGPHRLRPQGPHHARAVRGRRLGERFLLRGARRGRKRTHPDGERSRVTTRAGRKAAAPAPRSEKGGGEAGRRRDGASNRPQLTLVVHQNRAASLAALVRWPRKQLSRPWLRPLAALLAALLAFLVPLANIARRSSSLIPYAPAPRARPAPRRRRRPRPRPARDPRSRLSSYRSESRDDRSPPYGWNRPSSLPAAATVAVVEIAASAATAAAVVAAVSP